MFQMFYNLNFKFCFTLVPDPEFHFENTIINQYIKIEESKQTVN